MKANVPNINTNKINGRDSNRTINTRKIATIKSKQKIAKTNSLINDKLNKEIIPQQELAVLQKELPSKLIQRKTLMKIELESKDKTVEKAPIKEENIYEKLEELEAELNRLTKEENRLKTKSRLLDNNITNLLRDLDNRDNYISLKSHKLNKLKKDNVELKSRLEEVDQKLKRETISQPNETEEESNNLDDLLFRLISSYEGAKEEEEEEQYTPLSFEILQKIPIQSYLNTTNESEKCCLCDFDLCKNDIIMQIPSCMHIFHKECLIRFCQQNNICPLCKEEIQDI